MSVNWDYKTIVIVLIWKCGRQGDPPFWLYPLKCSALFNMEHKQCTSIVMDAVTSND